MIRLRETSLRWLRHPLVGPVLILCLAFALAFLALHEAGEGSVESLLAACATLAALAGFAFLRLRGNASVRPGPVLRLAGVVRQAPPPRTAMLGRAGPLRL